MASFPFWFDVVYLTGVVNTNLFIYKWGIQVIWCGTLLLYDIRRNSTNVKSRTYKGRPNRPSWIKTKLRQGYRVIIIIYTLSYIGYTYVSSIKFNPVLYIIFNTDRNFFVFWNCYYEIGIERLRYYIINCCFRYNLLLIRIFILLLFIIVIIICSFYKKNNMENILYYIVRWTEFENVKGGHWRKNG